MIDLEINDRKISVPEGTMVIEAAEQNGIYIPRFCYHKKLSIVANCRMCLVEIGGGRKPVPACATPVTANMKVYTASKMALDAQRAVMEFLLMNHPLDCPICDQGGECELQDLAMGYGRDRSEYQETKRSVVSDDLGPLIATEMTRCIHCTRCVRFGEEVAGLRELGANYRGEHTEIGTYVKHFMKSELSGNIIDLCPVGALTSKPFRFEARAWELKEHPMIAPHDCVGSNIFVHTRGEEFGPQRVVMRVVPRENEALNENWLADRDRFSYQGLNSPDRLLQPMVKRASGWKVVEWEAALLEVVDRTRAIMQGQGAEQIAALSSPNATVEEFYLLQKLLRSLGSSNIDHRLRTQDFSDQACLPTQPHLGMNLADLETFEDVFLIGADIRRNQPMLNHRLNKSVQEGERVMVLHTLDYTPNYPLDKKMIVPWSDMVHALGQIVKAAGGTFTGSETLPPSPIAHNIADQLKASKKPVIIFGSHAVTHVQAAALRELAAELARLTNAKLSFITEGCNAAGAWLAGAVPHREAAGVVCSKPGLHAKAVLTTHPVRAYFLFNTEMESDSAYSAAAMAALKQSGLVVCFTTYKTPAMDEYADILLPLAPFSETDGTYVNIVGHWQSFMPSSIPHGEAKPGWKILRTLGQLFEQEGFEYKTANDVRDELQQKIAAQKCQEKFDAHFSDFVLPAAKSGLTRFAPWPAYRADGLVRRATALQQTLPTDLATARMNTNTAKKYGFSAGDACRVIQGEQSLILPVKIEDRLADNTVRVYSGLPETAGFGEASAEIKLEKVS